MLSDACIYRPKQAIMIDRSAYRVCVGKAQQLRRDSNAIRADNLVEEIVLNLVGVF